MPWTPVVLIDSQFFAGTIFSPDTGTGARDSAGVDPVDIEQFSENSIGEASDGRGLMKFGVWGEES